jgi:hypothetical protein
MDEHLRALARDSLDRQRDEALVVANSLLAEYQSELAERTENNDIDILVRASATRVMLAEGLQVDSPEALRGKAHGRF